MKGGVNPECSKVRFSWGGD